MAQSNENEYVASWKARGLVDFTGLPENKKRPDTDASDCNQSESLIVLSERVEIRDGRLVRVIKRYRSVQLDTGAAEPGSDWNPHKALVSRGIPVNWVSKVSAFRVKP